MSYIYACFGDMKMVKVLTFKSMLFGPYFTIYPTLNHYTHIVPAFLE